jgi:hypothetical protein
MLYGTIMWKATLPPPPGGREYYVQDYVDAFCTKLPRLGVDCMMLDAYRVGLVATNDGKLRREEAVFVSQIARVAALPGLVDYACLELRLKPAFAPAAPPGTCVGCGRREQRLSYATHQQHIALHSRYHCTNPSTTRIHHPCSGARS